ncbi:MAG: hypothetical protein QM756_45705 [Polyangiaceae bacterium]
MDRCAQRIDEFGQLSVEFSVEGCWTRLSRVTTLTSNLLDRIVELWREPGPPGTYVYKAGVSVDAVRPVLEREFGVEPLRRALADYLRLQGERESREEPGDPRDPWLIDSAFRLSGPAPEGRLDLATLRQLLATMPSVAYSRLLRPWVKAWFTEADLLRVLADGVGATSAVTRASCLYGLRMYLNDAARASEQDVATAVIVFEAALRTQTRATDVLTAETVNDALKVIWGLHRKQPSLPRTTSAELTGYRCESGDEVSYLVERTADGYLALEIGKLEQLGDELRVEFKNHEPSLIPEDVPLILRERLFSSHIAPADAARIKRVRLFDTRLGKTTEAAFSW